MTSWGRAKKQNSARSMQKKNYFAIFMLKLAKLVRYLSLFFLGGAQQCVPVPPGAPSLSSSSIGKFLIRFTNFCFFLHRFTNTACSYSHSLKITIGYTMAPSPANNSDVYLLNWNLVGW